ncbi:hypothetical protein HDU93_009989 [Gonapodya sp. JEL0774]|nr:hypothetical protein HDU93_009989 [Gonapodya sp. JEL0774]
MPISSPSIPGAFRPDFGEEQPHFHNQHSVFKSEPSDTSGMFNAMQTDEDMLADGNNMFDIDSFVHSDALDNYLAIPEDGSALSHSSETQGYDFDFNFDIESLLASSAPQSSDYTHLSASSPSHSTSASVQSAQSPSLTSVSASGIADPSALDLESLSDLMDFPVLDLLPSPGHLEYEHREVAIDFDFERGQEDLNAMDHDGSHHSFTRISPDAAVVSIKDLFGAATSAPVNLSSTVSTSISTPSSAPPTFFSPPSPSDSGDSSSSSSAGTLVDESNTYSPYRLSPPAITHGASSSNAASSTCRSAITSSSSTQSTERDNKRARTTRNGGATANRSSSVSAKPPASTHSLFPLSTIAIPASALATAAGTFAITITPPTMNATILPQTLVQGSDLAAETLRIIKGPEKKKPGRKKKGGACPQSSASIEGGVAQQQSAAALDSRKRKSPVSDDESDMDSDQDADIKMEESVMTSLATSTSSTSTMGIPLAKFPPPRLDPSILHNPNFDRRLLDLDPATLPPADRKILRLLKNRASATLSRARRREKLAGLEHASMKLVEENVALKACVRGLEDELRKARGDADALRRENARLRAAIASRPARDSSVSSIPTNNARRVRSGVQDQQSNKAAVLFAVTLLGVAFLWGGVGEMSRMGWGPPGHGCVPTFAHEPKPYIDGVFSFLLLPNCRSNHLAQVIPSSPALFERTISQPPVAAPRLLELGPAVIELGPAPAVIKAEPGFGVIPIESAASVDHRATVPMQALSSPIVKIEPGTDGSDLTATIPSTSVVIAEDCAVPDPAHISYRNITDMFASCGKEHMGSLPGSDTDADKNVGEKGIVMKVGGDESM